MIDYDDVAHVSEDKSAYDEAVKPGVCLLGGEPAMKAAGDTFLPPAYMEDDDVYRARLAGSTLLNGYKKTVQLMTGHVFKKGFHVSDDMPDDVKQYMGDLTGTGESASIVARKSFQFGLGRGVAVAMVDAPAVGKAKLSKKMEAELGIRPFVRMINPDDVLGGIVEDGKILQVRVAETKTVKEGLYGTKRVKMVRVIEPGQWRLYREDAKAGKYVEDSTGTFSVTDRVPLSFFIPGKRISPLYGKLPLADLAYLNLAHWRSQSDQNNILHHMRVPFIASRGYDLKEMVREARLMINSNTEWAQMGYVEIKGGGGVDAGLKDIESIERRMALYGLQQLLPQAPGNATATEKVITTTETNSALSMWASEFEFFINDLMGLFGKFLGVEVPACITVDKDYTLGGVSTELLTAYYSSLDGRVMSRRLVFEELQRRGAVNDNEEWEVVDAEIEDDQRGDPAGLSGFFDNK